MEAQQLKIFTITYSNGGKDTTRHYDINEVKNCYLNKQVRTSKGTLEVCVNVEEK